MSRLCTVAGMLRITNRDNPSQFHIWNLDDPTAIDEAQRVATSWEDQELLADLDQLASALVVADERAGPALVSRDSETNATIEPPQKPRRGRKPRISGYPDYRVETRPDSLPLKSDLSVER